MYLIQRLLASNGRDVTVQNFNCLRCTRLVRQLLKNLYRDTTEYPDLRVYVWYSSCTVAEKKDPRTCSALSRRLNELSVPHSKNSVISTQTNSTDEPSTSGETSLTLIIHFSPPSPQAESEPSVPRLKKNSFFLRAVESLNSQSLITH